MHYDALPLNDCLYYTIKDFAEKADVQPRTVRNSLNEDDPHYKPDLETYTITVGSEQKVYIDQRAQDLFSGGQK